MAESITLYLRNTPVQINRTTAGQLMEAGFHIPQDGIVQIRKEPYILTACLFDEEGRCVADLGFAGSAEAVSWEQLMTMPVTWVLVDETMAGEMNVNGTDYRSIPLNQARQMLGEAGLQPSKKDTLHYLWGSLSLTLTYKGNGQTEMLLLEQVPPEEQIDTAPEKRRWPLKIVAFLVVTLLMIATLSAAIVFPFDAYHPRIRGFFQVGFIVEIVVGAVVVLPWARVQSYPWYKKLPVALLCGVFLLAWIIGVIAFCYAVMAPLLEGL